MSESRPVSLKMNKFHLPAPKLVGGNISIFTDPEVQMLRNEVLKFFIMRFNYDQWFFMTTLTIVEKQYEEFQMATEQKNINLQRLNSDLNQIVNDFLIVKENNHSINIDGPLTNKLISAIQNHNDNDLPSIMDLLSTAAGIVYSLCNEYVSVKSPNTGINAQEKQRLTVIAAGSLILDAKEILKKIPNFKQRMDDLIKLTDPIQKTFVNSVSPEAKAKLDAARETRVKQHEQQDEAQQAAPKFSLKLHKPNAISFKQVEDILNNLQNDVNELLENPKIEFNEFKEKMDATLDKNIEALDKKRLDVFSKEKSGIHHFSIEIEKIIGWLKNIKSNTLEEKITARMQEAKDAEEAANNTGHFHYRMRSLSSPPVINNDNNNNGNNNHSTTTTKKLTPK